MIKYVCGFLFLDRQSVVLIKKLRPDWQRGLLNGVGGKIEEGETEYEAMVREFEEEAGLKVEPWIKFAELSDRRDYKVAFFYAHVIGEAGNCISSQTDEDVEIFSLGAVKDLKTIPNIKRLITMALNAPDKYFHKIEEELK